MLQQLPVAALMPMNVVLNSTLFNWLYLVVRALLSAMWVSAQA